jgi:hypothetical protein
VLADKASVDEGGDQDCSVRVEEDCEAPVGLIQRASGFRGQSRSAIVRDHRELRHDGQLADPGGLRPVEPNPADEAA